MVGWRLSAFGYAGKILKVDLSSGNTTEVSTMDYAGRFLGGEALLLRSTGMRFRRRLMPLMRQTG